MSLIVMLGCAGSSSDGDTEPPVIKAFYPSRGQTDVPINTQIIVTFNKSVININNKTFYLEKLNAAGKIPATINYDDATNTAILKPLENLNYNAIYYVTLTSDIRSRAGVALKPESWAFFTGIEEDTIKPTIIDKSPQNQYYIDINTPIYVVFSEEVVNVSSATVYIKKDNTTLINADVEYNSLTKTAIIIPTQPLEEWSFYTVYCTDTITDNAGNHLDFYQFSFRTDDKSNPIVTSKYPEGSSVPINALIQVTFSESIKNYTVTNRNNFILERYNGAAWEDVDRTILYNDSTKTAICYALLSSGTDYRVTLSNNIRDLAHNPLNELQWEFTTADEPDTTPPVITEKNPDNNSIDNPVDTPITVTFSESVTGISNSSFKVERVDSGVQVSGSVSYNNSMRQATFTPIAVLSEGVWYKVTLTQDIKDLSNNPLNATSWQFRIQDTTKPYIVYKYPYEGAGNVGNNINIEVKFSEQVIGVNQNSFKVKNENNGQYLSGRVEYHPTTQSAIFKPDLPLPFEATFRVILTTDIKDTSNNTLNQTEWTFETGNEPDTTPPTIISKYPIDDATNIPISASIKIDFSEPVSGIGPESIQLKKGDINGPLVSTMIHYDPIAKRANVTPNSNLEYDSIYTVIVVGGTSTVIKDVAGNKFASTVIWSFTTTSDTTPPVVVFKTPEQGTPDIPGNAVEVRVIFSEQVQGVNNATFRLIRQSDNFPVESNVTYSYDPTNKISSALLIPLTSIEQTGTYRVELTTGITDISPQNNPLLPLQWTFAITALDETSPTVVMKIPQEGFNNWNNKKVMVVFSEDVRGVNGSSFYVKDQYNQTIPAIVTYYQGLLTAEIEVLQELPYEHTFTAYLTSAIKDRANNQLIPLSWSFSTPADTIPPMVVSTYPPNGTTGYAINGHVVATFSESIQGYSNTSFYLEPAVSAQIIYDDQNKTLTLMPQGNLQGDTTYTVRITTDIKDRAQTPNHMLNEYTWQFTTQRVVDTTPPEIVAGSRFPSPGATGVPLNSNVRVTFTEHVINATTKITLKKGSVTIPAEIEYNPITFTATLKPVDYLEQNTTYTVIVEGGTNGIKDVALNYLQTTHTWQFTTEQDIIPPSIVYRYPAVGATNVPLRPTVTVTFSEPVVNVTNTTFTLTGSGVPTCYVVYDEATRTATLTPGSELQNNTTYTVTLFNSIRDRYNNALQQTTWTFTTFSSPIITNIEISTNNGSTYSSISDGATNVNRKLTNVRISFNRPMNTNKKWLEIFEGASGSTTPSPLTPAAYSWSTDATRIMYTLKGQCKANTQYQFKLYGWGGSFEDTYGNRISRTNYVGDGILNFTTGGDSEGPLVIGTIPTNGATNVGTRFGKFIIRFNEMMNQTRNSLITINPSVTNSRLGWIEGGRTVVFNVGQLAANTTYRVLLNSGTTSFQDIAGNNASASGQIICTFTTGNSTVSEILVSEGFELYNHPYFSTFRNIGTDNADWLRSTFERSGNGTQLIPQQGSYFVKASSWEWNEGFFADVVTINSYNLSALGSYMLEFKMYHERIYNADDRIQVLLSVDGQNFYPIDAGAMNDVFRYDWSLSDDYPVWHTHYVDLSPFSGVGYSTVWIKLRAYSAGELGQNVIIDDLKVIRY